MTEHAKDIVAGILVTAMLLGVLLGGYAILRLFVER